MSVLRRVRTPPAPARRLTEFRHWPSPYGPDPYVFGTGEPEPGERDGHAERKCATHDVRWAGPGPCWCCAAGVA